MSIGLFFSAMSVQAQDNGNGCTEYSTTNYFPGTPIVTVSPPFACLGPPFPQFTASLTTPNNGGWIVTTTHADCSVTSVTNGFAAELIGTPTWQVTWPWEGSGSGTTITFTPTNCGTGIIEFFCAYKDGSGDTNVYTSYIEGGYNVLHLDGQSVSYATSVGTNGDYVGVKTTNSYDYVYVVADICGWTPAASNLVTWTGGQAVPDYPNLRRVPKNVSAKTTVSVSLCGESTNAVIWIVWGTVTIQTSGTNPPPPAPQFGAGEDGTENLGAVTWSSGAHGAGKCVAIGELTPSGVNAVIKTEWKTMRERWSHDWGGPGGVQLSSYTVNWVDDSYSLGSMWVSWIPDNNDKIYDIDDPDCFGVGSFTSVETYNNFNAWITWNGENCSEKAAWHYKARWKSSQTPQITLNEVGTSHIVLPSKPFYP